MKSAIPLFVGGRVGCVTRCIARPGDPRTLHEIIRQQWNFSPHGAPHRRDFALLEAATLTLEAATRKREQAERETVERERAERETT